MTINIGGWGALGIGVGAAAVGTFFGAGLGAVGIVASMRRQGYKIQDPQGRTIDWSTGEPTPAPAGALPRPPASVTAPQMRARWAKMAFGVMRLNPRQWLYFDTATKVSFINQRLLNRGFFLTDSRGNPSGPEMGYVLNDYAAGRPIQAQYT